MEVKMNVEIINQKSVTAVATKKNAISMDNISVVIGEGYGKIMAHLGELGKQMSGVPYIAYMNGNEDFSQFDLEMGVPVDAAVPVKDELYLSNTFAGKAIAVTYQGPYKEIESAYVTLMEYATKNKLELAGIYYDFYLNDPDETPESEWLTQVVFPLK
jgi:effector-binding domain-containing protein